MNGPITSCFLTITQVWLWIFSGQYLKQSRICGTLSDIFLEFKEIICHLLTFNFSFCEIIIGAFFIPNPTSSCLKKNPLLFLQNNLWLFDICSLYFFSFEEPKNVFYLLDFCSDEREAKFKEQKFRGSNQFRDHQSDHCHLSLCPVCAWVKPQFLKKWKQMLVVSISNWSYAL